MAPATDWRDRLAALAAQMPAEQPDSRPEAEVEPAPAQAAAGAPWSAQKERLLVTLSRKGRAGKTATIISGFTIPDDAVEALAAHLKRTLGTGGSARGGEILIQGDRRTDLLRLLATLHLPAR